MGLSISKSMPLAISALDYRALRQKMISSNIANVDTPYFKSRDIHFEEVLAHEAHTLEKEEKSLKLAKTSSMHLDPIQDLSNGEADYFFRGTHPTRNDGNNVDIDVETTEMSKNAIMFEALTNAIKKQAMIYKSVIDASGKIQ